MKVTVAIDGCDGGQYVEVETDAAGAELLAKVARLSHIEGGGCIALMTVAGIPGWFAPDEHDRVTLDDGTVRPR